MRVLLDSNILIRWLEPGNPDQIVVKAALDRLIIAGAVLCFTSQNLGEFWNTMTRPADRNGYGLSPEDAEIRVREVETEFTLLPDRLDVHQEWRRLLVAHRISGVQVHDARLVASMHVHGVKRILTFNTRDFTRFSDIEPIHPADLAVPSP
jgi:predicted nucleic acid-binding protein